MLLPLRCYYNKDPATIPDNYGLALTTLQKTERTLCKDEQWAATYRQQMADMVERGFARKLSDKEKQDWRGPKFYIYHLAISNPRSQSTRVRIGFNSSQVCRGASLNSYLVKGPDCYVNDLLDLLFISYVYNLNLKLCNIFSKFYRAYQAKHVLK